MVSPIPRSLLPHTADLAPYAGQDGWNAAQYGTAKALSYVRVEPSSRLVETKDNRRLTLSALLFFDCRNSLPVGTAFVEQDLLSFGGRDYTVVVVDTLYADRPTPHHYEIGLV